MDKLTKKMGFPVGSATLIDKVGIDVAAKISEYLGKEFGSRLGDSQAMVSILKEMVSKGMLGMYDLIYWGFYKVLGPFTNSIINDQFILKVFFDMNVT